MNILRPRRLRLNSMIRNLVAENTLSVDDLIQPIFIKDDGELEEIKTMPGIYRYPLNKLVEYIQQLQNVGIKMVALFPSIHANLKDDVGSEALNKDNLVCKAIKLIKKETPDILIMADVALDPYTSHGHDGIVENGTIKNDETVEILTQQALILAQAGADAVAPSDMMDGRILSIREALETNNLQNTLVISYAAKYVSAFYGPFRDAVKSNVTGSYLDKSTYQMDYRNAKEALKEVLIDIEEGADIILIKPALSYLDIIHTASNNIELPVFAYQVSGEYAALKFAAMNGAIDFDKAMMETLISMKRAGANCILTYSAFDIAKKLIK